MSAGKHINISSLKKHSIESLSALMGQNPAKTCFHSPLREVAKTRGQKSI